MNITLQLIQEIAEPNIVSRGRKYFQQHRVTLEEVTDSFVFAYVQGSDTYEVELFEDELDFDATCTCPYDWNGYCKHVVAAMFATMEEVGNVVYDSRKKRSAEMAKPAEQKTSWVNEVKKILPQPVPGYHPAQTQQPWRLVYSLNVSGGTWSVQQVRIKMRKNGSDGKASVIRQFDSSDRVHFDLTDRLLIALLTFGYQNSILSSGYSSQPYYGSYSPYAYSSSSSRDKHMADVLSLLIDKEMYRGDPYSLMRNRIHVRREPARLRLTINAEGTALSLNPEMEWQGNVLPFPKQSIILTSDPLWILLTDEVLRVEGATGVEFAALKQVELPLVIPEADREEFVSDLFPQIVSRYKIRSEASILKTVDAQPVPRLYLKEVDEKLAVELRFF
ncbi:MAG: SWIM zinc finger family protein [Bacteroidota bacterium]